jgi:hypothetical protein
MTSGPIHGPATRGVPLLPHQKPAELRQFGRRATCVHGWIRVAHRPKITCVVRNLSEQGALIEVEDPSALPFRFTLIVETINLEKECEVRHTGQHSVGVYFGSTPAAPAHPSVTPQRVARSFTITSD